MSRLILHIDMDAFFAAVEQHDDPSLQGRPVIIGADPRNGQGRGVVSTASYEARRYGVRSAMPISEAYRRCPDGVYIAPRMQRYVEVSGIIMEIFKHYSPCVEPLGIDEAFLDCSNMERLMGGVREIADTLKREIYDATGLTCSVGAAAVKSIAKIASDINKPDGFTFCKPGTEEEFLASLPVECLWGVGKKTREILLSYGIQKIGDLAVYPRETLERLFGKSGEHLWYLSHGIDERSVAAVPMKQKSMSEEVTFETDCGSVDSIYNQIKILCDSLTFQLRSTNRTAGSITIKIRYDDFETLTRSRTLPSPSCSFYTLHEHAVELIKTVITVGRAVRLVGVSFSRLSAMHGERQCDLFENLLAKRSRSEDVYTDLKERYGNKISRASLLQRE